MKLIAFAVAFGLVGCAGVGGEGAIAFPSGSHAGAASDAPAVVRAASIAREPVRAEPQFHAPRAEAEYFLCAHCR